MSIKVILAEQGGKGGGSSSVALSGIEVTTPPDKTTYLSGESFVADGMVVTASYTLENVPWTTNAVTGYTVSPTVLTDGIKEVTITYTENKVTKTTTTPVTVTHKLTSIAVTTNPTTMTYEYGDTFSSSGMVVTATYSDGATATVTGYSTSPSSLTTVGTRTITVSYTENGVTVTTTLSITVNRKSVTKPTWKTNLTYTGSSQSVTSTSAWNNYNTAYMTIGGTTSATNAGTYTATFTPGSNYRWSDGTTDAISVNWTMNKMAGTLTLSTSSIALSASSLSGSVTVTTNSTGTISYSPTSVTGLTISNSGKTYTFTGNGTTALTQTFTFSVAADSNHTAPSSQTVTVTATYWSWGDETAIGDATWWAGLKSWAASATATERSNCKGKKKKLTLSADLLGVSSGKGISMICIGSDLDGTGTLAFQTEGTFPTSFAFGSSQDWPSSTARTHCTTFYNNCSAKASIKTVSKGLAAYNSSRSGAVTYASETVWLPSEREMGLDTWSSLSTANSSTSKAECTSGYNAAYPYYTDATSRIKYQMDSTGSITTSTSWYWERSRYYNSSNSVCSVYTNGNASNYVYSGTSGRLAPAFVIG